MKRIITIPVGDTESFHFEVGDDGRVTSSSVNVKGYRPNSDDPFDRGCDVIAGLIQMQVNQGADATDPIYVATIRTSYNQLVEEYRLQEAVDAER